jgi:hypothetical protein
VLAEDVPLIESLEASKRLATEIGEKVAEAAETEIAINDSRNKYRYVVWCCVTCMHACMQTCSLPVAELDGWHCH